MMAGRTIEIPAELWAAEEERILVRAAEAMTIAWLPRRLARYDPERKTLHLPERLAREKGLIGERRAGGGLGRAGRRALL